MQIAQNKDLFLSIYFFRKIKYSTVPVLFSNLDIDHYISIVYSFLDWFGAGFIVCWTRTH